MYPNLYDFRIKFKWKGVNLIRLWARVAIYVVALHVSRGEVRVYTIHSTVHLLQLSRNLLKLCQAHDHTSYLAFFFINLPVREASDLRRATHTQHTRGWCTPCVISVRLRIPLIPYLRNLVTISFCFRNLEETSVHWGRVTFWMDGNVKRLLRVRRVEGKPGQQALYV